MGAETVGLGRAGVDGVLDQRSLPTVFISGCEEICVPLKKVLKIVAAMLPQIQDSWDCLSRRLGSGRLDGSLCASLGALQ